MAKQKDEPEFTVTDRRRFSTEGESKETAAGAEEERAAPRPAPVAESSPEGKTAEPASHPPAPTAEQQREQKAAYHESTKALDEELRKQHGAQAVSDEFNIGWDRVLEPFYITAMMQLGMMGQEGPQRRVDIIGARQTIDTLALLQEKTKGNLTADEQDVLERVLYQLRMAYVDMTNALAKAVQQPGEGGPIPGKK